MRGLFVGLLGGLVFCAPSCAYQQCLYTFGSFFEPKLIHEKSLVALKSPSVSANSAISRLVSALMDGKMILTAWGWLPNKSTRRILTFVLPWVI
jgi:hypothetical protein